MRVPDGDVRALLSAERRRSWGVRRSTSAMLRAVVNHEFIPCWVFARRRCLPSKSVKTRSSAGLPLQSR
jgi:hypothetical protein